jgi:hypothetical protein
MTRRRRAGATLQRKGEVAGIWRVKNKISDRHQGLQITGHSATAI